MRYFIIFLLLFSCSVSHAQMMEGIVVDSESKKAIAGVTVLNKHSKAVVFSDSDGYYIIKANQGDSLLFSHTSYRPVFLIMPYTLGKVYEAIQLQIETYGLKQATIKGITKYQQDSLAKEQMYEHVINKTQPKVKYSGLQLDGGVSYLADKILGVSKKTKKFKDRMNSDEQQQYIDTRYTPAIVSSQTGMKDTDSVAAFMNKYPMEYQYARQASDLEIKLWIRQNYEEYITTANKEIPSKK